MQLNRTWKCTSGLWRLSTICAWLVKTLYNVLFFVCTLSGSLLDFLDSFVYWLRCFHFLNVANHWLRSALNSAKHVHCRGPAALSSASSIICQEASFPVLDLHHQCMWHMSFWACTWSWVPTVSANWHSWAWQTHTYISRHVRTHVHCENRSLIQSLVLMHSAIINTMAQELWLPVQKVESDC